MTQVTLELYSFFRLNFAALYFAYGLTFFLMGFAVLLEERSFHYSAFRLAQSLRLLGVFGLLHGLAEWGFVFIPLHAEYASSITVIGLRVLDLCLVATSYLFLFMFGSRLLASSSPRARLLQWIPLPVFAMWFTNFLLFRLLTGSATEWWLQTSETWARYLLGLPGAVLSSAGLLAQRREVAMLDIPRITGNLVRAAVVFAIYAFSGGLVVPPAPFPPASLINTESFFATTGVPIQVFRALCGLAMAFFVIRTLEIFDIEVRRRLDEAERRQAVYQERERIGRDLHDGVIQSIYAIGLSLENCAYLVDETTERAKAEIGRIMERLNGLIRDIRSYILDLGPLNADLEELVRRQLDTLTVASPIQGELHIRGVLPGLSPVQVRHISHVTQEALNNVLKHSRATRVEVEIGARSGTLTVLVRDNGWGFTVSDGFVGHGLQNMRERARILGGELTIRSRPGFGTEVFLEVPLEAGETGEPDQALDRG
ncbi:MAG: sensor histidine kinase [Bacillota bacterium]|nr:sensor histidine kinase [Bacillota bacterium]